MQETLGCTSMYILDDKDAYDKGVADAFESAAGDINLEVAGHEGWDADASNYKSLFTKIKASGWATSTSRASPASTVAS